MKRITAIVITCIVIIYFFGFFISPFLMIEVFNSSDIWEKIILVLVPMVGVVLIIMMVMMLRERLTEIDKGEDNDISKY